jgi:hypothetical protein
VISRARVHARARKPGRVRGGARPRTQIIEGSSAIAVDREFSFSDLALIALAARNAQKKRGSRALR